MDAAGEPDPFEIDLEFPEIFRIPVALIGQVNVFQRPPDTQIVPVVLVPGDIPPGKCGLVEIVDQFFPERREVIETGYTVTQDFQIGELFCEILEFRLWYLHLLLNFLGCGTCNHR